MNPNNITIDATLFFIISLIFGAIGFFMGWLGGVASGRNQELMRRVEREKNHEKFALQELPGEIFCGPPQLVAAIKERTRCIEESNKTINWANRVVASQNRDERYKKFEAIKLGANLKVV